MFKKEVPNVRKLSEKAIRSETTLSGSLLAKPGTPVGLKQILSVREVMTTEINNFSQTLTRLV